jgi:hypothetical protein
MADGASNWQVRAIDNAGNAGAWSAARSFTVNASLQVAFNGPIQATDGIHDAVLPELSPDTEGPLANNTGLSIILPLIGMDAQAGASIQIVWGINTAPTNAAQTLTAVYQGSNGKEWIVRVPAALTAASAPGSTFWFQIVVGGQPVVNAANASNSSWGITMRPVDMNPPTENEDVIKVVNTVIEQGGTAEVGVIYTIARTTKVYVAVYNIAGDVVRRLVDNSTQTADTYVVTWDGKNVKGDDAGRGIYFIVVRFDDTRIPPITKILVR